MVVVQEAFDVPTDIMTKLATGEYRRIGGVVRYASGVRNGQIVKLLKPVDSKTTKTGTKRWCPNHELCET